MLTFYMTRSRGFASTLDHMQSLLATYSVAAPVVNAYGNLKEFVNKGEVGN